MLMPREVVLPLCARSHTSDQSNWSNKGRRDGDPAIGGIMSQNVHRLKSSRLCNEAVDGFLDRAQQAQMMAAAAKKLEELFDVLHIDHLNDHNTRDPPRRVAKMFVEEILHGRYNAPPTITEFENVERYDHLIVTGPIEVR